MNRRTDPGSSFAPSSQWRVRANDSSVLQQDLDRLSVWESDWDMEFNPSKCQVVQVTGYKKPINAAYKLHGVIMETVTCARYLGVDITSNLSWGSHIDRITGTANRTLGFVRRNIRTKMSGVREAAYTNLVRPQLEYAAAIWDPNHDDKIKQIEKVQRRAARWTTCNFGRTASVTDMIETLGWRTLEQRRADARLCLFFKIINNMAAVPYLITSSQIPAYLDAAILGHFANCKRQRTTISTLFPRLQLFGRMRSQKKLLARQTLTYSRQQLASCNTESPRSQV